MSYISYLAEERQKLIYVHSVFKKEHAAAQNFMIVMFPLAAIFMLNYASTGYAFSLIIGTLGAAFGLLNTYRFFVAREGMRSTNIALEMNSAFRDKAYRDYQDGNVEIV